MRGGSYVNAKIDEVEAEAGIPVHDVEATLKFVGNQLRFTDDQQTTILNHFIDGGARSCGGVMHAITSTAQTLDDADDADDADDRERQGLRAMTLATSFQY